MRICCLTQLGRNLVCTSSNHQPGYNVRSLRMSGAFYQAGVSHFQPGETAHLFCG